MEHTFLQRIHTDRLHLSRKYNNIPHTQQKNITRNLIPTDNMQLYTTGLYALLLVAQH